MKLNYKNEIVKKVRYHVENQIGESTKMSCFGFDMITLSILMFRNFVFLCIYKMLARESFAFKGATFLFLWNCHY